MDVFDYLAIAGNGRYLVCRSSARWMRHCLCALSCALVGGEVGAVEMESSSSGRCSRAQMSRVGSSVDGGGDGGDSNGYTRILTASRELCICADVEGEAVDEGEVEWRMLSR